MGICRGFAAVATVVLCVGAAGAQVEFGEGTPESVGLSGEALEALGAVVEGYVEREYALGAELLVIKDRRVVFHRAYGWADREGERPWEIGTLCNIRSMSKTLTGAAAQILIDRGELGLDDLVSAYLPGFDNDRSREITVRQVLTHRSGLPLTILEAIDEYPDLLAQANAAGERGPDSEPGSRFWYSDAGTDVVGAIVEVVSGERLDAFVARELLAPLGMADSFYGIDDGEARLGRVSSLYIGAAGAWTRFWRPTDGALYPFAWGSQTIYSSPLDYARFLAMWMDGGLAGERRLLSPEAVARTTEPVSEMKMLGSDERFPTGYRGLGVYYGQMAVLHCPEGEDGREGAPVILGHSGSDGTIAWAWPERDLMVLYFTQSRGGSTPLRLESEVDRLLIHPGEPVLAEEAPAELAPLMGTYIANFATYENERFEVLFRDGGLALDIPSQMVFALLPPDEEGRRAFAVAPDRVHVTFGMGEDGVAEVLRLHQSGQTFEVPREGTALAEEQSRPVVVAPEVLESVAGEYRDPESGSEVEVFVGEDGGLSIRATQDVVLQLRPVRGREGVWLVRQNPSVTLSFERDEGGAVVSMTRHVGGETLVMPRVD